MRKHSDRALEAIGTGECIELPSGELRILIGPAELLQIPYVLALQHKDGIYHLRVDTGNNPRGTVLFCGDYDACIARATERYWKGGHRVGDRFEHKCGGVEQ